MADFVSDTFTDTAGTNLSAHTGGTGATWTAHPSSAAQPVISNANRLRGVSSSLHLYYASGVPASAAYSVSAIIHPVTTLESRIGVVARLSTSAYTCYLALFRHLTGWQLFRVVAGAFTQLGADSGTNEVTSGTPRTLKLDVSDSAKVLLSDGVTCITNADNTITAAGRAGLWYNNFNGPSNTTGFHWDNFVANEADVGGTFTGTSALSAGGATLSAAGTFSAGTKTAAATLSAGGATLSSSGTRTAPVYTAAGAFTVGGATAAGSATTTEPTYTGSAALVAGAATAAGTGTSADPIYTAAGAFTVGGATLAGSGTSADPVDTGAAALAAGAATLAGAGIFAAEVYSGTAALTTAAASLAAAGAFTVPVYTGSASLSAGAATIAATATFAGPVFTAVGALTVGAATLAGAESFALDVYTATGALVAGPATLAGVGTFAAASGVWTDFTITWAEGTLALGVSTLNP